jgi:hypothetical protein
MVIIIGILAAIAAAMGGERHERREERCGCCYVML